MRYRVGDNVRWQAKPQFVIDATPRIPLPYYMLEGKELEKWKWRNGGREGLIVKILGGVYVVRYKNLEGMELTVLLRDEDVW